MKIDEDDNGNRASVADLCKKFESPPKEIIPITNISSSGLSREKKPFAELENDQVITPSYQRNLQTSELTQNGVTSHGVALKQNGYGKMTSKISDEISDVDEDLLSKCNVITLR